MTLRAGLEDTLFSVEVEASSEPRDADAFACAVILAICTASVTPSVGRRTYGRCLRALAAGATARLGFRHPGKADAIDAIWRERHRLYGEYAASADKLGYLATLPWIGPMTRRAAAWNLGLTGAADEPERRAVA
ncbi:MAG TPA: hypothetical protein VFS03_03090 [Microvirga sp.]|jgi:hypothetical protein|nr:hypothetical protein [Microvirga sp.]